MKCCEVTGDVVFSGGYEKKAIAYDMRNKKAIFKQYVVHDIVGLSVIRSNIGEESDAKGELQSAELVESQEEFGEAEEETETEKQTGGDEEFKGLEQQFFDGF